MSKAMMCPIHQNDPRLAAEPSIGPYGCLVTTLREIVETHERRTLSPEKYLEMYRWLVEHEHVQDDNELKSYVLSHDAVGRAAQYYLGVPQSFEYVARRNIDKNGDSSKDFGNINDAMYFVAEVRCEGWDMVHFLHSDVVGERMWDPYWPAKEITRLISLRGYRI